ncbi:hypothetical protein GGI24_005253, partial [Coemansia furcata]
MQPMYAPGPGSAMNHDDADSAIPAPRFVQQPPPQQMQPVYQANPGYQQPQPSAPPGGYYTAAPPGQHYAAQGQQAQVQYQGGNPAIQHQQVQRVNESAGWDQYDDGSEESLDLYSHHQRSRQQQQQQSQQKPNPSMSADSAIHNGSYASAPAYGTEAAGSTTAHSSLTDDFRRMGISTGQTVRQQAPPVARKNVSSEALRKREQELEDAYDDDDGIAGADIDVTLFPTNSRQMAHIGRSEKYGTSADSAPPTTAMPPASAPPQGKNHESTFNAIAGVHLGTPAKPTHKPSLLQSHPHFAEKKISPRVSPRHVRSFVSDSQQQHSPVLRGGGLAKSASLSKSLSSAATSVHSDWHDSELSPRLVSNSSIGSRNRYPRPSTPAKQPSLAEPKGRILRRRSSRSRHPSAKTRSASTRSAQLQPLPPHWSKCTKRAAPGAAYRSNSTNHTTTHNGHSPKPPTNSTVVRNPALALAGGGASPRLNMSRNGSPMGAQQPPQDMAGGQQQRFYGSTGRAGPAGSPSGVHSSATTSNSSPVYAGRPYANDNGFDSSSERIAGGGGRPALQQYPPQQQQGPYPQQPQQQGP